MRDRYVQNAGYSKTHLVVMGDDYKTNVGSGIKIVNELPNNQNLVEGNPD